MTLAASAAKAKAQDFEPRDFNWSIKAVGGVFASLIVLWAAWISNVVVTTQRAIDSRPTLEEVRTLIAAESPYATSRTSVETSIREADQRLRSIETQLAVVVARLDTKPSDVNASVNDLKRWLEQKLNGT